MSSWICYYTQPHRERRAQLSLLENKFEVFLPMCIKLVNRNKKLVQTIRPLFPRYIFARGGIDLVGSKRFNGISDFASSNLERSLVSHEMIQAIKDRLNDRDELSIEANELISGQNVKIISGPFAGLDAIFSEADDQKRSYILLEMIGKTHKVRVSNSSLRVST